LGSHFIFVVGEVHWVSFLGIHVGGWRGGGDVLRSANADVCGAAGSELREGDFHGEMEAKAKMNW